MKKLTPALLLALLVGSAAAADRVESEEIVVSEPVKEAPADLSQDPKYSDEEKVLLAIQAEGRQSVAQLAAQLAQATDAMTIVELNKQIAAVKLASRVRLLEQIIQFADASGEQGKRDEALRILQLLTEGAPQESQPVQRPLPQIEEGR